MFTVNTSIDIESIATLTLATTVTLGPPKSYIVNQTFNILPPQVHKLLHKKKAV